MIGTTRQKTKIPAPCWRQFFLNRSNEITPSFPAGTMYKLGRELVMSLAKAEVTGTQ